MHPRTSLDRSLGRKIQALVFTDRTEEKGVTMSTHQCRSISLPRLQIRIGWPGKLPRAFWHLPSFICSQGALSLAFFIRRCLSVLRLGRTSSPFWFFVRPFSHYRVPLCALRWYRHPIEEVDQLYDAAHKRENVIWKRGRRRVLLNHFQVASKFDFGI